MANGVAESLRGRIQEKSGKITKLLEKRAQAQPELRDISSFLRQGAIQSLGGPERAVTRPSQITQQRIGEQATLELDVLKQLQAEADRGSAEAKTVTDAIFRAAGDNALIAANIADRLNKRGEDITPFNVERASFEEAISPEISLMFDRLGVNTPKGTSEFERIQKIVNDLSIKRDTQELTKQEANQLVNFQNRLDFLSKSPEALANIEKQKAEAKKKGQLLVEEELDLFRVTDTADDVVDVLDQMLIHPGLEQSTGGLLGLKGLQASAVPVTPSQIAFATFVDQVRGKAFLEAFQSLKGGGHITEIEGQKATEAIARLNQRVTPKEYRKALIELRDISIKGVKRAKNRIKTLRGDTTKLEGALSREIAPEPTQKPTQIDFDPALLEFMTPEERALFE